MYVNNEIGAVQDIKAIADIVHGYNKDIYMHTDAIQACGKFKIFPKKEGIDLLSVSAHKLHGPKGSGFLYIDERVNIKPIIYGGGQQRGLRSGTLNIPGIAGLGEAAKEAYDDFDKEVGYIYGLRDYLIDEITKLNDEGIKLNSEKGVKFAPPCTEHFHKRSQGGSFITRYGRKRRVYSKRFSLLLEPPRTFRHIKGNRA